MQPLVSLNVLYVLREIDLYITLLLNGWHYIIKDAQWDRIARWQNT